MTDPNARRIYVAVNQGLPAEERASTGALAKLFNVDERTIRADKRMLAKVAASLMFRRRGLRICGVCGQVLGVQHA